MQDALHPVYGDMRDEKDYNPVDLYGRWSKFWLFLGPWYSMAPNIWGNYSKWDRNLNNLPCVIQCFKYGGRVQFPQAGPP